MPILFYLFIYCLTLFRLIITLSISFTKLYSKKAFTSRFRGTQREILRKRPKNNNKARIKFFETILSILGDCWKKIYLFLTPSKTDGRVPSQQGAPATCNLTYRRVQTLLASLGVVIWQNSASSCGEWGGRKGWI